ncbi:hypothetical protein D4R99_01725, partial [bacterium]
FKLIVFTNCYTDDQISREKALQEIKDGKPKLLLFSGIVPIEYSTDEAFSKKYKVSFYEYGCIPDKHECMLQYNRTVFEYLDKTYGKIWRKEVRQDVFGLNDE